MSIIDTIKLRLRAFRIWQKLGYNPWHRAKEKRAGRDFYKGAFDSIPFLNNDAKRTFSHLLLRPGYMIRDYIRGDHERYLAPLTALIIFYAFFALVSAVLQPVQKQPQKEVSQVIDGVLEARDTVIQGDNLVINTLLLVKKGSLLLSMDKHPEEIDTRAENALAALEGTLRSQGIPLFLGKFLLLWLSFAFVLRRYSIGMSASAAASAYVLCQFSFFKLFTVLFTWGESTSIGLLLMMVLLMIDFCQWLNVGRRKSFSLALKTGISYGILYGLVLLTIGITAVTIAYFKGA